MDKIYLSVDGGGTKLHTLLFDEDLHKIGSGRSGSVNPNFVSRNLIKCHMEESIDAALGPAKDMRDFRIEDVWISMPGPKDLYESLLRKRCPVSHFHSLTEGETAIYSAGITSGVLVLSGTGATLFYISENSPILIQGGWGSPFGDEGSGADIGCMGIRAALRSYDGWGMKTSLESELCGFFGCATIQEMMKLYWKKDDKRGTVASVCRLVGRCAQNGDFVAQRILANAGAKLAEQTISFLIREQIPEGTPVVLGGGAWKSGDLMITSFCKTLASKCAKTEVVLPLFDPVIGPIIKKVMKDQKQLSKDDFIKLKDLYPEYLCEIPLSLRDSSLQIPTSIALRDV